VGPVLGLPLEGLAPGHTETDSARRCIKDLLEVRPRITALFTGAGDLTMVVVAAARELGLHVPCDLALAGFDDYPYYAYFSPPVTAVRQPIYDLGEAALDMLFTLMDGREPESRGRVLPVSLVIRSSCGHAASVEANAPETARTERSAPRAVVPPRGRATGQTPQTAQTRRTGRTEPAGLHLGGALARLDDHLIPAIQPTGAETSTKALAAFCLSEAIASLTPLRSAF
jgi:hypothetical protein